MLACLNVPSGKAGAGASLWNWPTFPPLFLALSVFLKCWCDYLWENKGRGVDRPGDGRSSAASSPSPSGPWASNLLTWLLSLQRVPPPSPRWACPTRPCWGPTASPMPTGSMTRIPTPAFATAPCPWTRRAEPWAAQAHSGMGLRKVSKPGDSPSLPACRVVSGPLGWNRVIKARAHLPEFPSHPLALGSSQQ